MLQHESEGKLPSSLGSPVFSLKALTVRMRPCVSHQIMEDGVLY